MSSKVEHVTATISGTTASAVSNLLSGYLTHIKIEVRTAAGATSSNTCNVTITDDLARPILTVTGITGIANHYPIMVEAKGADGAAVDDVLTRIYLAGQKLNIAVASGTTTEVVTVYGVIAPQ